MKILDIFKFGKKNDYSRWNEIYKQEKLKFKVPEGSIYTLIRDQVKDRDGMTAYTYFGNSVSYKDFMKQIDNAAKAFRSQGIRKGDVVTICMPNTPEAVISFYAPILFNA